MDQIVAAGNGVSNPDRFEQEQKELRELTAELEWFFEIVQNFIQFKIDERIKESGFTIDGARVALQEIEKINAFSKAVSDIRIVPLSRRFIAYQGKLRLSVNFAIKLNSIRNKIIELEPGVEFPEGTNRLFAEIEYSLKMETLQRGRSRISK